MATVKEIQATIERIFFEMWNQKKIEVVRDCFAKQFVVHYPPDYIDNHSLFEMMLGDWFSAFPDKEVLIDEMSIEGNKAWVRWHGTGTHRGDFLHIPATNKAFRYSGITLFKFDEEGKMQTAWVYSDLADALEKLKE